VPVLAADSKKPSSKLKIRWLCIRADLVNPCWCSRGANRCATLSSLSAAQKHVYWYYHKSNELRCGPSCVECLAPKSPTLEALLDLGPTMFARPDRHSRHRPGNLPRSLGAAAGVRPALPVASLHEGDYSSPLWTLASRPACDIFS
jgi:hypothetical protein